MQGNIAFCGHGKKEYMWSEAKHQLVALPPFLQLMRDLTMSILLRRKTLDRETMVTGEDLTGSKHSVIVIPAPLEMLANGPVSGIYK